MLPLGRLTAVTGANGSGFNEPESSLHPDLLPALARLIANTADRTQILVVTHSTLLLDALADVAPHAGQDLTRIELTKELGQTSVVGQGNVGAPPWTWPPR